jgi:hypothetical protein
MPCTTSPARPERSPFPFAFGGEALPTDYARAIADGGLLALIACLGLMQLSHETTPSLAQLGFTALTFYGLAALPYRLPVPTLALAAGMVGLGLSGAPAMASLFAAGGALLHATDPPDDETAAPGGGRARVAIIIAVGIGAAAIAAALDMWEWRLSPAPPGQPREWQSLGRLLLWFTWPAWPLALWTVWRWRRQLGRRHVALPLWFALVGVLTAVLSSTPDRALLLALPALATLAAFALPTFERSMSALIDWFTLLFFSGCALVIWVIWISLQTGVPAKPAANVARLAPGVRAQLLAAALRDRRGGHHRLGVAGALAHLAPPPCHLEKPGAAAGGTALGWLLVLSLCCRFWTTHAAMRGRAALRPHRYPGCVEVFGLTRAQIAALALPRQAGLQVGAVPQHLPLGWWSRKTCSSRCPWPSTSAAGPWSPRSPSTDSRETWSCTEEALSERASSRGMPAPCWRASWPPWPSGVHGHDRGGRYSQQALAALSVGSAVYITCSSPSWVCCRRCCRSGQSCTAASATRRSGVRCGRRRTSQ